MKIKKALCLLLAVLLLASAAAVPVNALEAGSPGSLTEKFIDEATGRELAPVQVSKSQWTKEAPEIAGYEFAEFSQETEHIYSQEDLTYIIGYPDKTVGGERNLQRSEAVAIFYRLHAGAFPALKRQMSGKTFSDVPARAWYYDELETCYNIGMVEGTGEGCFSPEAPITRAEFAALAARFASLPNDGEALFNDVSPEHWAYQTINAAAKAGWIKGYPDGTFKPDDSISRAEAVSLINRMRNRVITASELKKLGVVNPYTDLVETYWAYGDLLEATVKHSAADWHKLNFADTVNRVVERFVDENGKEIAEAVTTEGAENHAYKEIKNFRYMGYVTTITYVYQRGAARLAAEKSVDKTSAKVGDKLVYRVAVGNENGATDSLKNVVLVDALPGFVDFIHGSVQVDGVTAQHSFDNGKRQLSVNLGEIKPEKQKIVTFGVTVKDTAYGQKFSNTAILTADNHTQVKASDPGVEIAAGETRLTVEKAVDKASAKVGDKLTYTITARNAEGATVALENVVLADTLPAYVDFSHGSVQLDGTTAKYSFDSASRKLTVQIGNIEPKERKAVTFEAEVNASAYGKSFKNTAVLTADNSPEVPASDGGTSVKDGAAVLMAAKSVDKSIYLHRFDVWLREQGDCWHDKTVGKFHNNHRRRNLERTGLKIGIHVRYADDILVICKSYEDAVRFRYSVTHYLTQNMRLKINEEKTRIYDLTKEKMKYLGYEFYVFKPPPKCVQQKGMYMVANTLPQKKEDEIVDRCRELLRAVRKHPNFETIHDWNTYVVGIQNYYKGMTHFCMNFRKIGWRIKKLFYHTMERNVTFTKEQSYKNNFQRGGYRSWGNNGYYCFNGYPVVEIQWSSWDSWLLAGGNGVVKRENPYSQKERKQRPGVSIDDIEYLVRVSKHIKSSRLALFRISKYSSTKGISYLSGEYVPVGQYHCHHIKPLKNGGTNDFNNLCVLSELEHMILRSTTPERLYDLFPKKKKRIKALIEALCDKAA